MRKLRAAIRGWFFSGRQGGGPNWFPLALIALAVAAGLLFFHLFMVLMLTAIVLALGIWVAEKILGPGTRISLRLPTRLKVRLAHWLGISRIR